MWRGADRNGHLDEKERLSWCRAGPEILGARGEIRTSGPSIYLDANFAMDLQ
jgi:hypothetical protein